MLGIWKLDHLPLHVEIKPKARNENGRPILNVHLIKWLLDKINYLFESIFSYFAIISFVTCFSISRIGYPSKKCQDHQRISSNLKKNDWVSAGTVTVTELEGTLEII